MFRSLRALVRAKDRVVFGIALTALTALGLALALLGTGLDRGPLVVLGISVAFIAGGVPATREAIRELLEERKFNVDLLMVVAALGALSVGRGLDGGILLFLFSLSNTLQDWALGRTKNAIQALVKLTPAGAWVQADDGSESWVDLEEIRPGDRVRVKPGGQYPADGRIIEGFTSVDESALTGESLPVDKETGDEVLGGTMNRDGVVLVEVLRGPNESALAKLIRLVEEAQAGKSPTERFAERLEGPYTRLVIASIPVIFLACYLFGGMEAADAWYRGMTFLVVASPCAVVISTPAAMLSAMATGARSGVLFKGGAAIESLARVRLVAMDKTGTVTTGVMSVQGVYPVEPITESELLRLAAGLERHAEHPVARAISSHWHGEDLHVDDVQMVRGKGVRGRLEKDVLWAGNEGMARDFGAIVSKSVEERMLALQADGVTTALVGKGERVLGFIGVSDTPRPEARSSLKAIAAQGMKIMMLTGDKRGVAENVARKMEIGEFHAELLPENKLRLIRSRQLMTSVAMVGDGVNDAPALIAADVGIAMGSSSDVSLESADIVLMNNDLSKLEGAVRLARKTDRIIRANLTFALGVIVIVGVLSLMGHVPLPLAVIAHEGGTILVVANGLRLLGFRV